MQGEFGELLRDQGDQAGVVGARADFGEDHRVALDEELDPEQAMPAEGIGDRAGLTLGLGDRNVAHRLRLPGFAIVARFLAMADRRAEGRAAGMANRQQGDLVVEIDEALDDAAPLAGASTRLRVVPGGGHFGLAADQALALAGRAHDRFDHEWQAEVADRRPVVRLAVDETIGRGRQAEFLGGEATDAFAVHGQPGGARGRDHVDAFALEFDQGRRVYRFDLGHDQVGLLERDQATDRGAVEHVDDMAAVGHLHGRCIGIAVDRDDLDGEALQLDRDFLAELARAEQHRADRAAAMRRSKRFHRPCSGLRVMRRAQL